MACVGALRTCGAPAPLTLGVRQHEPTPTIDSKMNNLCLLTNLSSSDVASWAQAIVSSIAIGVGAWVVIWQTNRTRLEGSEREARALDGLARLLIHLKDTAREARAERAKLERWPPGHPAEPSTRFRELADAIHSFPLESVNGEVAFEALLNARRAAREMQPLVGPEPELDLNPNFQAVFVQYIGLLEQQILLLRSEADRLVKGKGHRHAATASSAQR